MASNTKVSKYAQGNPQKQGAFRSLWPILQVGLFIFLARMGLKPFVASLTDWLAGHHLLLMGFCRGFFCTCAVL